MDFQCHKNSTFDVMGILDMSLLQDFLSILFSPKNAFYKQIANNIKIRCTELLL